MEKELYELTELGKARFWSKVKDTGYCWEWVANKDSCGYGVFKVNGKDMKASRIAYSLINGDIPESLHVCHKCDNPGCVNPDHLFTGTHQDNMNDKMRKGRGRVLGRRSKYLGVGWRNDSDNWRAYIAYSENGKRKHISIGGFDTQEGAAHARDSKVLELGLDLPLNFARETSANGDQEFLQMQFPGKDGSDIHKPTEAQEQEEIRNTLKLSSPASLPGVEEIWVEQKCKREDLKAGDKLWFFPQNGSHEMVEFVEERGYGLGVIDSTGQSAIIAAGSCSKIIPIKSQLQSQVGELKLKQQEENAKAEKWMALFESENKKAEYLKALAEASEVVLKTFPREALLDQAGEDYLEYEQLKQHKS